MKTLITLLLVFSCLSGAQEQPRRQEYGFEELLQQCASYQFEDADSLITQAVYFEQGTMRIVRLVEWVDGGRWIMQQIVPLNDIDIESIAKVAPDIGLAETFDQMEQHGGLQFQTRSPSIVIEERREDQVDQEKGWSAFIRIDDELKRQQALIALMALAAREQKP